MAAAESQGVLIERNLIQRLSRINTVRATGLDQIAADGVPRGLLACTGNASQVDTIGATATNLVRFNGAVEGIELYLQPQSQLKVQHSQRAPTSFTAFESCRPTPIRCRLPGQAVRCWCCSGHPHRG